MNEMPSDLSNDDEHDPAVSEGWAALDQLLSQSVPKLSTDELDALAGRLKQRLLPPPVVRRRRFVSLAAAAALLAMIGGAWLVTRNMSSHEQPQVVDIGQDSSPKTSDIATAAWDDDWPARVVSAQQQVDDVETQWRDPDENWVGLRTQMEQLEAELAGISL
jgi:hypothetical protein